MMILNHVKEEGSDKEGRKNKRERDLPRQSVVKSSCEIPKKNNWSLGYKKRA